jgi:hypothetical protein
VEQKTAAPVANISTALAAAMLTVSNDHPAA